MSPRTMQSPPLRRRNLRVGLAVLAFILLLYVLSVIGVMALN